jgi:hypothetical protein
MPATPFKRLILRAVLRDTYSMVIRLVAVPDSLDLTDFDDIFHAVLGWIPVSATHSRFKARSSIASSARADPKKLRDFRLHHQEKFLYILGALDQWEVETTICVLAGAHPDRPANTRELLRSVLAAGAESLDRRLEQSGRLELEGFNLKEANERLAKLLEYRRFP